MALLHSMEKQGLVLFKYRGQVPLLLFAVAVPVIFLTDCSLYPGWFCYVLQVFSIFLSVFGFLFRAYAIGTTPRGTSGRNTKEQVAETLNNKGIYSIVRHPLYVGNYFMWIGIVMFTLNVWFVLVVTLAFWLYYERIMFAEERFLERKFGNEYINWSNKVPAFIPAFGKYKKGGVPFSLKSVLRREYSGVLATVVGFVFVGLLRDYFHSAVFELNYRYVQVLAITAIITFVLRSLKHYTKVLNEEGRS